MVLGELEGIYGCDYPYARYAITSRAKIENPAADEARRKKARLEREHEAEMAEDAAER